MNLKSAWDKRLYRWRFRQELEWKFSLNGFLSPAVYRAVAEAAQDAPAGDFLEIGPGQGASTVALLFGSRNKSCIVHSIDKFEKSSALDSWSDVGQNVTVLRENIASRGFGERHTVVRADDQAVLDQIATQSKLALLFIDADGAVDRDFLQFYQALVPGAKVIIDDYSPVVNRRGTVNLRRTSQELESWMLAKGVSSLRDTTPMGKNLTTWRLTNPLIELGFLEIERVIESTLFARKPARRPLFDLNRLRPVFERERELLVDFFEWARAGLDDKGSSSQEMAG